MLEYLQNRWSERSTRLQLVMVAVLISQIIFPQYAGTINQIAIALGLGSAALPDKSKQ